MFDHKPQLHFLYLSPPFLRLCLDNFVPKHRLASSTGHSVHPRPTTPSMTLPSSDPRHDDLTRTLVKGLASNLLSHPDRLNLPSSRIRTHATLTAPHVNIARQRLLSLLFASVVFHCIRLSFTSMFLSHCSSVSCFTVIGFCCCIYRRSSHFPGRESVCSTMLVMNSDALRLPPAPHGFLLLHEDRVKDVSGKDDHSYSNMLLV